MIEIWDLSIQGSRAQDQGNDQSQAKSFSHKIEISLDPPNFGLYVRSKPSVNNEKYKPLGTLLGPWLSGRESIKRDRLDESEKEEKTFAFEIVRQALRVRREFVERQGRARDMAGATWR